MLYGRLVPTRHTFVITKLHLTSKLGRVSITTIKVGPAYLIDMTNFQSVTRLWQEWVFKPITFSTTVRWFYCSQRYKKVNSNSDEKWKSDNSYRFQILLELEPDIPGALILSTFRNLLELLYVWRIIRIPTLFFRRLELLACS